MTQQHTAPLVPADEPKKRPAFQFYPGDWRKDVELRSCSLEARGLWIDLMCVMHDCDPYGHLMINGKAMTPANMAGQIGVPAAQIKRLLDELIENGVARMAENGAIYSKRMTQDERLRNVRAAGGKDGLEHGIKGAEHGHKGGRPKKGKGGFETPLHEGQEPPPSSSSSSSPSGKEISHLSMAPALRPEDRPPLELGEDPPSRPKGLPDCPHAEVLALWAEVLPALPQHLPTQWRGTRADHLRARWREAAAENGWTTQTEGLAYLRTFFGFVGRSAFLTGRVPPQQGRRPFQVELEWLVNPTNWAKVHEGKFHQEAA